MPRQNSRSRVGRLVESALQCFILVAVCANAGAQPSWPARTVRIIVPVSAGGGTDNLARLFARNLQDVLGRPVIIENRPGAATLLGTEAVAHSAPDGYTLLIASDTHLIIPFLMAQPLYDPLKDFTPVAALGVSRYVLSVHPSVPAHTLQELIALARAAPDKFNFAGSTTGSGSNIAGEIFNMLTGARLQYIPYRGAGQAQNDVLAGRIQVSFNTPMNTAAHIRSGRLRALAVSGASRVASLPDVPTFAEAGLPAFQERSWVALYAPAGTPGSIIERLAEATASVLALPDVQAALARQSVEPFASTPAQFSAELRQQSVRIAAVIKAAKIPVED